MVQLILSVPNVSMKVYSTSVPGAVGWVDGLICWEEQLRNIIAVANERVMFLRRDSGGMGKIIRIVSYNNMKNRSLLNIKYNFESLFLCKKNLQKIDENK